MAAPPHSQLASVSEVDIKPNHAVRKWCEVWAANKDDAMIIDATELDSHANMVVVGKQATIIQSTGLYADVSAFSNEVDTLSRVPIVDACFAYDCPYRCKSYILVVRNALHVKSMEHNLIPPFIMREAGLTVNEVPKVQVQQPTIEDHSIYDENTDLRIALKLRGIFSYFDTRSLTEDEVMNSENLQVIFLTPDCHEWNPYNEHWADQEDEFLDTDGEMSYRPPRPRAELIGIEDMDVSSLETCHREVSALRPSSPVTVDAFDSHVDACISSAYSSITKVDDEHLDPSLELEDRIRCNISYATSDPTYTQAAVSERLEFSKIAMAMGSTTIDNSSCELFEATVTAEVDATTAGKAKGITADALSKIWRIDHKTAEQTIAATSQLNRQSDSTSLTRNFGTNDRMLRYRRIKSWFYTDTFFVTKKGRSTRGYTCMQVFVSDKGFVKVYPMEHVRDFPKALKMFAKDVGAPEVLVADPHPSQASSEVKAFCNKIGTTLRLLEQKTQWANRAELYVGLLKEAVRKDMREMNSPLVLWDYCAERRASIFTLTARDLFQLQGTTPYTATFGEEGDISNLCQFGWYEWVYFYDDSVKFPHGKATLGRCLGPARNEGNEMAQWVLKANGKIVPRRTCSKLTASEAAPSNEVEAQKRKIFDDCIRQEHGDSFTLPTDLAGQPLPDPNNFAGEPLIIEKRHDSTSMPQADAVDSTGQPILQQSMTDTLINAEVMFPQGEDDTQMAKVVGRSVDSKGQVIGQWNENKLLNTLVYDVEFPDGNIKKYAANVIAENVLNQCDIDGHYTTTMKSIVNHRRDGDAVRMADKYIKSKANPNQRRLRETTVGWHFLVRWSDGTETWIPLKDLKESNPVDIAEYVTARGVADEPAFAWWVPYTLRKRDVIVAAVNTRVRKKSRKYGIEVPTSVKHALELDAKNKDTFWADALSKEMSNVGIAFELLQLGEKAPPGWTKASGHLIFDVKMDFTRKARWVKDGHRTPDSTTSSYAGVVSKESIRIALTYAALHNIDVFAADIRNAYLQAPSSEKHYVICGPEFGIENQGKVALIKRALYGGKVAGRDFWHHLRSCMEYLGFKSSLADPDVWFREAKREDGTTMYEYVLLYTDDCLVISDNAEYVLRKEIGRYFTLKEESIGPPSQYLGGKLSQVQLANGTECWGFSSTQYVQAAVSNVEEYLAKKNEKLYARAGAPLSNGYRPEIDMSEECGEAEASYYHSLIGVLRWIVELGRADICVEVSMMSSHLALPRVGHLKEVLHIFAYLKKHSNAEMVFDPSLPKFNPEDFPEEDWSYSIYSGEMSKEEIPPNMPKPLGTGFRLTVYVDSDHAGDTVTRRSRTGFVVFLNSAPIHWMSKKQTSTETSTFGSEFCAMKQATEYVRGLRYKLRMMGIPVEEPAYVYGDNQSVLANTTKPGSTLKKKCTAIAYHFVRQGCASNEWRTAYVNTHDNVADLMTKPLPSGEKRWKFVRMLLYHI